MHFARKAARAHLEGAIGQVPGRMFKSFPPEFVKRLRVSVAPMQHRAPTSIIPLQTSHITGTSWVVVYKFLSA